MGWLKEELENLYWNKKLSCVEIAHLKRCTEANIRYHMRKMNIPRRTKSDAFKLIDRSYPQVYPSLEMSKELAYILGVLAGDGWINKNHYNYRVALTATAKDFAKSFLKSLQSIGLHPTLYKIEKDNPNHHNQWRVEANSKIFYEWYKKLTWKKIEALLRNNLRFVRAFLRGFYESEGNCQHRTTNCWRITIYNSNSNLISFIQKLIMFLGFEINITSTKRRDKKTEYSLRILGGTKETYRFLSIINPSIKRGCLN